VNSVDVGLDQFAFYATLVLAFLLCLVYLGVGLRVLREDTVGGKVAQFYGYSVCLVAVIALLISVGSLAAAVLDWSDPLHAVDIVAYPQRSLASFETYKMDILNPPYGANIGLEPAHASSRADQVGVGGAQVRSLAG
jgi:hypothetical protein